MCYAWFWVPVMERGVRYTGVFSCWFMCKCDDNTDKRTQAGTKVTSDDKCGEGHRPSNVVERDVHTGCVMVRKVLPGNLILA